MEEREKQKAYRLDLGEIENLDHELPIITDINSRFQHTYIIGKTGVGKSVLMERMFYTEAEYGAGIYIDPHGDSVKKLYHLIEDKDRIEYISIDRPMVINPLNKPDYNISDIIAEFVQILDVLITLTASNPESTVLMREIISMTIRALKPEDRNIDKLAEFLIYPKVRFKYEIDDLKLHEYWKEFDAFDHNLKRNREKIESGKRVASRLLEICEGMEDFVVGENQLDIVDIVENKKILLVDLSRMTRNKRIYISNLIIYAIVSYCEFKSVNKPLFVYVDEFQTTASKLFSELLGKTRKYKVGFVLAHHDFQEISEEVLSSIFGNVDTYITFRCGDVEAKRISKIYGIDYKELVDLEKYQAWVRIGIDNTLITTDPPLLKELPPDFSIFPPKQVYNFLRDDWY